MTLFGWDASDYDWRRGPMNMVAARNAGVTFFTYKATEGTTTKHAHYGEVLTRARDAGIEFLGAYIVPRSGPSVLSQVDYFMNYVNAQTPWWTSHPGFFFQVDTEKWSSNGVVYDAVSPQRGADVCAEIRRRTNRQVVHYAPNWSYGNSIPQPDPLWASSYGNNGVGNLQTIYPGDNSSRWSAYSGRTPVFLQFGSKVVIGGQGTCDGNAFRGTVADLRKFITGSSSPASGSGKDEDVLYLVNVLVGGPPQENYNFIGTVGDWHYITGGSPEAASQALTWNKSQGFKDLGDMWDWEARDRLGIELHQDVLKPTITGLTQEMLNAAIAENVQQLGASIAAHIKIV